MQKITIINWSYCLKNILIYLILNHKDSIIFLRQKKPLRNQPKNIQEIKVVINRELLPELCLQFLEYLVLGELSLHLVLVLLGI